MSTCSTTWDRYLVFWIEAASIHDRSVSLAKVNLSEIKLLHPGGRVFHHKHEDSLHLYGVTGLKKFLDKAGRRVSRASITRSASSKLCSNGTRYSISMAALSGEDISYDESLAGN